MLIGQPVVNVAYLVGALGISTSGAARGLERLEDAGIVSRASSGTRNRVWQSIDVLADLDAFAERVRRSSAR